jgi:ribonuclease BN (tRNA processing enzyme)
MELEILGGYGGESRDHRLTCILVDGTTALDAGSLSQALPVDRQVGVRSIVLTHSHMDHTSSLPFFIENVYGRAEGAVDIYASQATIYSIRKYLFNNATWPDFTRLPNHLLPAVRFHEIRSGEPVEIDGVRFTPIPVDHLVPTHGFLIEKDGAAVLWSSDTGPTQRLWEVANRTRNLQAVCIETSFDNSLQRVADLSLHLTPRTLQEELRKLSVDVPVLLHHLKPPCIERIHEEVRALGNPSVDFLEQGRTYRF